MFRLSIQSDVTVKLVVIYKKKYIVKQKINYSGNNKYFIIYNSELKEPKDKLIQMAIDNHYKHRLKQK